MLRKIVESGEPTSRERVAQFEQRWHVELPESYRAFLVSTNGGRPVPGAFPIGGMEGNPVGVLQAFFGLDNKIRSLDLDWTLENLGVPQPRGLVPIGCTEGDDFVCISTLDPGQPVVFWDRMACWGKGEWSSSDFYPVTEDFERLLAALHDFELSP